MKVLFAVDGSECSSYAVESVIRMKCPVGTEFKIVTAVDFYHYLSADVELREAEVKAASKLIESTIQQFKAAHPNIEASGKVLDGHVVESILKVASDWPADLIMVGSHGRTGLSEFVMGSVSRAILSNADCAVRVVRPMQQNESAASNILLCLDDSNHSRHLIDHVLRLPWTAGSKFKLLNIVPEVNKSVLFDPDIEFAKTMQTEYEGVIDSNTKWLAEAAERINSTFDQEVASCEVKLGDPRKEILGEIKRWPAHIVMLGSHGKRGLEKLFLGSVSEAVATHAPCSVEVTRMPAMKKQTVEV